MYTIATFTLVPVGKDISISKYVAACIEELKTLNVNYTLHANGTNIEGDWDEVFSAIKQCQIKIHDMGPQRIFTTIQLGTRTDKKQQMENKIDSVLKKIK